MTEIITFDRSTNRLSIAAASCTTLDDRAKSLLRNILVLAAEEYEGHANTMKGNLGSATPEQKPGLRSLADRFFQQADDTRRLLALLDGDDDADADTAVIFVANGGN